MLRPTLRLAVFLLIVVTAVWIWTIVPRDDPAPTPDARAPVHEVTATALEDGRVRLVDRALGMMGTEVTLTLFGEDEARLRRAATKAFARIEAREGRLSKWRRSSDVSRVNASAGEPVAVRMGTYRLLERAIALGLRTGGAFDVTVGPLVRFWGSRETWPTDDEVATARSAVGLDRIELAEGEPPTVTIPAGASLDLGGIAKGTIVDAAAKVLTEIGVTSFLINAGGDLLGRGPGPDGNGLLVALRDPGEGHGVSLSGSHLRLCDAALCTSGSYERFREIEGRRVSHIVDPRTGRPVESGVVQASVLAPSCETADAWATALMVLDSTAGLELVKEIEGLEALLVVRGDDGRLEIRKSPGFSNQPAEDIR